MPAAGSDRVGTAMILRRLEGAVRRRDSDAAAALGADRRTRDLLRDVVDNAGALDVTDFGMREPAGSTHPDGARSWTVPVRTTWRFAGTDRRAAETAVPVGLRRQGGGVRITGIDRGAPGRGRVPLWLAGPVSVASSPRAVVLVAGDDAAAARRAAAYQRHARRATRVVARVLPDAREPLVLEVPGDGRQLEAALGVDAGTYAGIAAVTTSVDGAASGSPVHVFANPRVLDQLRVRGVQVVLSHEAVHVATRASSATTVPWWLLEGFADFVALRDVDLPLSATAGQIVEQVRADGAPRGLPGPAELGAGAPRLGAAYESAWVVCLVLADRAGEQSLVDLYRTLDDGTSLARALREGFGWSAADLTRAWRAELEGLASGPVTDPDGPAQRS